MFKIEKTNNGVTFKVRVQLGAAKNEIVKCKIGTAPIIIDRLSRCM